MSGFPRSALPLTDGVLQMTTSVAGEKKKGWSGTTSMAKIDAPNAVPSTAIIRSGIAYSPDGAMYTTTAVPTATSVSKFGYVVRNDGAMHIDKTVSGVTTWGHKRNSNGVWITT